MRTEIPLNTLSVLKHYCKNAKSLRVSYARYSTGSSVAPLEGVDEASSSSNLSDPPIKKLTYEEEKFRILELTRGSFERRKWKPFRNLERFKEPRANSQSVTQDWGNTWPAQRMFHPASIPLPIRMGYPHNENPSPDKWGNLELIKIPNFFHLTPPVIKRQCEAIKKFCTDWPTGISAEEEQRKHFPVTVSTSQYLHASPTLRDPRARVVKFKVPLDSLKLDEHAKDKFLRLVGPRYDQQSGMLTITADRCPISKQNFEYCVYLLTVIYNESLKTELWEHERDILDLPFLIYKGSTSDVKVCQLEEKMGSQIDTEVKEEYKEALLQLHNEGEDKEAVKQYGDSVLKLLNLN